MILDDIQIRCWSRSLQKPRLIQGQDQDHRPLIPRPRLRLASTGLESPRHQYCGLDDYNYSEFYVYIAKFVLLHIYATRAAYVYFEINSKCYTIQFSLLSLCVTDSSCENTFRLNSMCYKVHKPERVNWFTAVNRCLANNARLAVFDDNVHHHFPSSLLSEKAWIGLVKSWWTWPGLSKMKLDHINFIVSWLSFCYHQMDQNTARWG